MKKVIFISDYFLDEIVGGAELCNEALIQNYLNINFQVQKIKSINVNLEFLINKKEYFFIIANYMQLS